MGWSCKFVDEFGFFIRFRRCVDAVEPCKILILRGWAQTGRSVWWTGTNCGIFSFAWIFWSFLQDFTHRPNFTKSAWWRLTCTSLQSFTMLFPSGYRFKLVWQDFCILSTAFLWFFLKDTWKPDTHFQVGSRTGSNSKLWWLWAQPKWRRTNTKKQQ